MRINPVFWQKLCLMKYNIEPKVEDYIENNNQYFTYLFNGK
jgi:hypothetical protein